MKDSLSGSVYKSLFLHLTIAALLTVRALFMPSEPLDLRQAIRVDVVGLPDKEQTLPEQKPEAKATPPPPAAPESKPAPAPPPKPAAPAVQLRKTPKTFENKKDIERQKDAVARIKALATMEKFKKEMTAPPKAKPVRGNIVASGEDLTGLNKMEFDRYFKSLESRIRENWSLPQWLADAHLRAQALVQIDSTGMIRKKQIVKTSGNQEFDDQVLAALEKSAPFPAPPDRLRDVLSERGIIFNFPQRGDDE